MDMKRLLVGLVFASALSVSLAAQGKQTALIVLNTPAAATSATTWEPRLGDYVTFTTDFPARLDRNFVYIQVLCYQNGAMVFSTAGRYDRQFRLGGSSSTWLASGGPASCHADLYYWAQKYNQLAWTDFSAQG
jgi:hypothetical protein